MTTLPPTGSDAGPPFTEADLARIANEFYRAWPGAAADPTGWSGPVEPSGPAAAATPSVRGNGGSLGSTPTATGPVSLTEVPGSGVDPPIPPRSSGYYTVGSPPTEPLRPNEPPVPAHADLPHPPQFYFLSGDLAPLRDVPAETELLASLPSIPLPTRDVPVTEPLAPGAPFPFEARPVVPSSPQGEADLLAFLPSVPLPNAESPVRDPAIVPDSGPYYFLTDRPGLGPTESERFGDPGATPAADAKPGFDLHAVRRDFPILQERVNGQQLVWFDNGATTQKPRAVIDRLTYFYEHENSNIQRSAHELARRSTDAYENARRTVANFLGATSSDEIVFVRGTTEGINLVANTFGKKYLGEGDELIISHLEHHANIVPWQLLAKERGFTIKVIPIDDAGNLLLDEYHQLLSDRTKLVSVTQVSNALGTVTPTKEIIDAAHAYGAKVLIDGAQSVAHLPVNVQALGADFFVFSGHKIYGPTGIGALYGRYDILEDLPPWEGGGHMIEDVTLDRALFNPPPTRFEAGTGNIADAVGLAAALDYVSGLGLPAVAAYEDELLHYATPRLKAVPGLTLVGTADHKAAVLSFVLDGFEPLEVGEWLNRDGIAVRAGHHCAQPALRRCGYETTVRPTLALYNTPAEIDLLIDSLHRLVATRRV